jgi:hypothetical protein
VAAALAARLRDAAIVVVAAAGLWFAWSQYSYLSGLSWWYDNVQRLRARTIAPPPDYDLATLPWQVTGPRAFDIAQGQLRVITSHDPYGYQALANVKTGGARAADIQFDMNVESGGASIGLLQGGRWIAINSTQRAGPFADSNSARLGYRRSLTVVIANDNPAGESRVIIKSLRVYLRK